MKREAENHSSISQEDTALDIVDQNKEKILKNQIFDLSSGRRYFNNDESQNNLIFQTICNISVIQ